MPLGVIMGRNWSKRDISTSYVFFCLQHLRYITVVIIQQLVVRRRQHFDDKMFTIAAHSVQGIDC